MPFFWKSIVIISFLINSACAFYIFSPRNTGVNHQDYQVDRIHQNLRQLSEELAEIRKSLEILHTEEKR